MHGLSTSQSGSFLARRVHPVVLRCVAVLCVALAVLAIGFAIDAISRRGAHYMSGAIAASLIGAIFVVAAFLASRAANRRPGAHDSKAVNRPLRAVAFLISLPACWGGALALSDSAMLLNQEYLQWFSTTSRRSFGDYSNLAMLLETFAAGAILTIIGFFLLWFALFIKYRYSEESPAVPETTPSRFKSEVQRHGMG